MKRLSALFLTLVMILSLTACAKPAQTPEATVPSTGAPSEAPTQPEPQGEVVLQDVGTAVPTEGNARVYYQIFVGSFSDSNGDGIGDLRGIIDRFDYLNDGDDNSGKSLGIEGIWLTPIFASPSYHKYDTTDYYTIDPSFGTMEDLRELIDLCHSRNVQIILDLVINHTSSKHPWFAEFRTAHREQNTQSPYYEYYSYSAEKATGFCALQGSTDYYEGNFSWDMPELNYDNPEVRQAMVDVAKFYLDMGVDGFRFDAAKYIYYGDEARSTDFWDWYMAELRAIKPDIYTVAEVWDSDGATIPYFSATNCFNFSMSQTDGKITTAARKGNVNALMDYVGQYIEKIREQRPDAMPITFLTNHDMDRAAGFLTVSSGQAQVAANLAILMPGSTFLYYGEEIGMKGSRGGANTDADRRLAMLWGDGDTIRDPEGASWSGEQSNGTVAEQILNPDSLYTHYKRLIALRRANPEIASGEFTPLSLPGKAGGFLATLDGSTVAVIHNTTGDPVTIDLTKISVPLTVLTAAVGLGSAALDGTTLTIDGQTSVILK